MDIAYRSPTMDEMAELTASVQRAFADYPVPMTIDDKGFAEFVRTNDIVLEQSVVAVKADGGMVGQSMSGRRGERAWVGGTGLSPELRGKGVGMGMVTHQLGLLKEKGATDICLEVLATNTRAKRIYQANGFKPRRDLYSFKNMHPDVGKLPPPDHLRFEGCEVEAVLDVYRPDNPWQAMRESVEKMTGCQAFLSFLTVEGGPTRAEGLGRDSTDPMSDLYETQGVPDLPQAEDMEEILSPHGPELEGYCVYRVGEKGVSVIDLYSVGNARELLRHLITITERRPIFTTNMFDATAIMAFETLKFERWIDQHELSLSV